MNAKHLAQLCERLPDALLLSAIDAINSFTAHSVIAGLLWALPEQRAEQLAEQLAAVAARADRDIHQLPALRDAVDRAAAEQLDAVRGLRCSA